MFVCSPCRAALSLSLVRYSTFIAWGWDVRRFVQLILSLPYREEDDGDDVGGGLAVRPSARPSVRVLVSSHLVPCLVPLCRSKQEAAFSSTRLQACLVPRLVKSSARCSFRLVSRPGLRLVVRLVSCRLALSLRSHLVPSCPICRTLAVRLVAAPFCSAHLVAILPMPCRPHRLMTGYRRPGTDTAHAIGTDEQGSNEP